MYIKLRLFITFLLLFLYVFYFFIFLLFLIFFFLNYFKFITCNLFLLLMKSLILQNNLYYKITYINKIKSHFYYTYNKNDSLFIVFLTKKLYKHFIKLLFNKNKINYRYYFKYRNHWQSYYKRYFLCLMPKYIHSCNSAYPSSE